MGKQKLTIRDIARMAKVSHMTVSRVLNNDPRVRDETRKRILKLVNKVNYRPDGRARTFVSKKSNLIGLVVSDISNPFYAELARGIEDKAHEQGYNVIFCSTENKADRMAIYVRLMMDAGVDALWPLERAATMNPLVLRRQFGKSLRLWGGVDKRELAKGPRAIRAHLRELIPLIEEGGFIPTVDHTVPPDVSWDNFRYYMDDKAALLSGEFHRLA